MKWVSFLEQNAQSVPNKTALIDQRSGRRLSYKDLDQEASRWASYLSSQGVNRGDRVTLLATNRLEHLTIFLASAKLGAIFVPLNFRLAVNELSKIVAKTEPKLSIGLGECEFAIDNAYLDLDGFELPDSVEYPETGTDLSDPLLMLFTSGSTGEPKGVLLHGEMLASNQRATCENWKLVESDITMVDAPFFHTGGYNVLCLPLLSLGGTVIISEGFDVNNVFNTIPQEKVTVFFAVPTMFHMLGEDPRFAETDFSSIRFCVSGGAACPKSLIDQFSAKNILFKQGFGLTEVGPNCFLLKPEDAVRKMGSIGKPMPHSIVKVVKTDGQEASMKEAGELLLKGPHVCAGYFKDEERFAEVFENEYFHTGDLVQFDEEGFFYVVGRIKDMYISGGENVYPGEVEEALCHHENILQAIVVAVPHDRWGEVGYAYLQTAEKDFTVADLREYLNPLISRYKHPHHVEQLVEFPLLPNGKVDRVTLKEMAANAAA